MPREPFETGDHVWVKRSRHGWHDGRLRAQVVARHQRDTGTWSYVVRDPEGNTHDIAHTRDLLPATTG